jgi:hypothetical protein
MSLMLGVLGAFALFVSLWFPWFVEPELMCDPAACPPNTSGTFDGWQSFAVADVLLAALSVASGVLIVAARLRPACGYAGPLLGWLTAAGSLYAVSHPAGVDERGGSLTTGIGFFVALSAAGCILVAGLAAAQERSPNGRA